MSRFRLRHQNTDLEMPSGDLVVGRGDEAHLALEDPMVSRRHAILRTSDQGVVVEDLGSRNGVWVNSVRVKHPTSVNHGDIITIGSHDLTLIDRQARLDPTPSGAHLVRCRTCGEPNAKESTVCRGCRRPLSVPSPSAAGRTIELSLEEIAAAARAARPKAADGRDDAGFRVVANIADKSLSLGRYDEAEKILGRHLDEILARAGSKEATDKALFDEATKYALKLSEGRASGRFITYVFELHTRRRKLMEEAVIDRLHELVRRTRYSDRLPIDAYLQVLESMSSGHSASDRFIVRRLTALQRVISA